MLFSSKFLVVAFFVVIFNVSNNKVAAVGPAAAAVIELAAKYGTPFAETALGRLHGNIFGKGRATRSTDVVIFNKSNKEFKLTSSNCAHGGYSTDLFPIDRISGKESTVFGMESHGFATGCECTTKYTSTDGGSYFEVTANNPYIGSNSLRETSSSSLKLTSTKGQGDNNQVRWLVEDN